MREMACRIQSMCSYAIAIRFTPLVLKQPFSRDVRSERFTDGAVSDGGVGRFLVQIFTTNGRAKRDPSL